MLKSAGGGGGGGSGSVTSVATNNGVTGGPITTTGTVGLAPAAANTIKGNNTGSSAVPTDLTVAQTNTLLGTTPVAIDALPDGSSNIVSTDIIPFEHDPTATKVVEKLSLSALLPASGIGAAQAYTAAAGAANNVNPGGTFPTGVGRINVDTTAGSCNFTGLLAGTDGQIVLLTITAGTNNLTLNNNNAGSTAANRFLGSGDLIFTGVGNRTLLIYQAGSINRWCMG